MIGFPTENDAEVNDFRRLEQFWGSAVWILSEGFQQSFCGDEHFVFWQTTFVEGTVVLNGIHGHFQTTTNRDFSFESKLIRIGKKPVGRAAASDFLMNKELERVHEVVQGSHEVCGVVVAPGNRQMQVDHDLRRVKRVHANCGHLSVNKNVSREMAQIKRKFFGLTSRCSGIARLRQCRRRLHTWCICGRGWAACLSCTHLPCCCQCRTPRKGTSFGISAQRSTLKPGK